jgi:hypothetical protein
MSKILKYSLRILAGFCILWLIIGLGTWIYFRTHKPQLTARANAFLNTRFRGNIHIRDIGINLWDNFPYPALQVNGVTIDDSVYARSGQHTLALEKIRIIPGFKGLLSGNPSIREVVLEGGGLYLCKNNSGYYNGYVWSGRQNNPGPAKNASAPSFPAEIELKDVSLFIGDSIRRKSYSFQVHRLSMIAAAGGWRTSLEVMVRSLAFSTRKGSFLKDQEVKGKGVLDFSPGQKTLSFERLALDIGKQHIVADGAFHFDTSSVFSLHISAPSLDFPAGRSWLPHNIGRKLDSLAFERPLALDARIDGKLSNGGDPRILVRWVVRSNTLSGYIGTIYDCSFSGYFSNTVNDRLPPSDANSLVCADSLEGKYENSIVFHTRRLEIIRLDTATLAFDLSVHNDVGPWEDLLQSDALSFDGGTVDLDLKCRYPLTDSSGISPDVTGDVSIKDARITYLPRKVKITDGQVQVAFNHQDMVIRRISGKIGNSPVQISGSARNFLALANTDTSKMVLDWKVYSPSLDVDALLPFLGKGASHRDAPGTASPGSGAPVRAPGRFIDRYFKRCKVNTRLQVDCLSYGNFVATQVNAQLLLNNGNISLSQASLSMAKGSVSLSGSLGGYGDGQNKAKLNAILYHLDLSSLFYAFNDFGQASLGSHNIAGTLNAQADLSLLLTDKGRKVPGSLEGSLNFSIDNGALLNFSPLMKLSNFALKKRDLSHVYFSQLHDIFTFSRDTLSFNKMEIQSSVLEMFVEGAYKLDGDYTNADIQVPFSNIKKRKGVPENVGVDAKHGLSIYVHAYNTGNEPLHYKLRLFKKKNKSADAAVPN